MFMIPVCNYCPIYQLLIVDSTIFNQLLVMTYDLQVTIFFYQALHELPTMLPET